MNVLLILAIWMTSPAGSPPPPQSTVLGVGSPVDRSIAAGDSHTFDLRLDAGQAAVIEIEEDGLDVTLTVTDPSGDTIAQAIDLFGGQGRRQMVVSADTAGPFVLTVSARPWPIASGSYTLVLTGVRPSTASDRDLLRAMRLRAEVGRAEEAINLELAVARAAEALAVVERGASLSDSDLALFIFDLARVYHRRDERQKAWPLYERSLSLLERSVGPDHPRVARVLSPLGAILTDDGEYVRADAMIRRALEIQEKALSPDDPALGTTLRDFGYLLERRGDLTKAQEIDLRALAILEKAPGRTRLLAGDVLNNLGVIYIGRRDYQRAGEYLERALPLMEAFSRRRLCPECAPEPGHRRAGGKGLRQGGGVLPSGPGFTGKERWVRSTRTSRPISSTSRTSTARRATIRLRSRHTFGRSPCSSGPSARVLHSCSCRS